jgi:hypothetical protein
VEAKLILRQLSIFSGQDRFPVQLVHSVRGASLRANIAAALVVGLLLPRSISFCEGDEMVHGVEKASIVEASECAVQESSVEISKELGARHGSCVDSTNWAWANACRSWDWMDSHILPQDFS